MNTKHTQGEFYAKDGQIIVEETGKTIALIPYFDNDNEEQKANQSLFAASKELLETLNELMDFVKFIPKNTFTENGKYNFETLLQNAQQAINKAKGE